MADKQKKQFKSGFDKVRGIYWTSSPPPSQETQKREIAVKNMIKADEKYIEAVNFTYLPQKPSPLTGTCIAYNKDLKEITVDLDIYKTGPGVNTSQPREVQAKWGRPTLTETEVNGKRVKLWVQRETNPETKQEEVKGLALSAIAPEGSGLFW